MADALSELQRRLSDATNIASERTKQLLLLELVSLFALFSFVKTHSNCSSQPIRIVLLNEFQFFFSTCERIYKCASIDRLLMEWALRGGPVKTTGALLDLMRGIAPPPLSASTLLPV